MLYVRFCFLTIESTKDIFFNFGWFSVTLVDLTINPNKISTNSNFHCGHNFFFCWMLRNTIFTYTQEYHALFSCDYSCKYCFWRTSSNIHIYQIYLWTPGFPNELDTQLLTVIVDTYEKLLNNTHLPDMPVGTLFTVFIELFETCCLFSRW